MNIFFEEMECNGTQIIYSESSFNYNAITEFRAYLNTNYIFRVGEAIKKSPQYDIKNTSWNIYIFCIVPWS